MNHHDEPDDRAIAVDLDLIASLREAGRRPEVPDSEIDAIRTEVTARWQISRARRRKARVVRWAVAASLALLAISWGVTRERAGEAPPAILGEVTAAAGTVMLVGASGDPTPASIGRAITAGSMLETNEAAHLELRLNDALGQGGETIVRVDRHSRLRLPAAGEITLEQGAIYAITSGAPVAVRTPWGTVRDIGTRFEVRLLAAAGDYPGQPPMRVRVRDGTVVLDHGDQEIRAGVGVELVVSADGEVLRHDLPADGATWDWVLAAAPLFDLEERTLDDFLAWLEAETGLVARFEPAAAQAAGTKLHGSIEGLEPDDALEVVLASCGLRYSRAGSTLTIDLLTTSP